MDTDILTQLVHARLTLLVELHEILARQAALIGAGDLTRLFSLLAIKQRTLNELVSTDRKLDPFRQQDPEQRVWRSADDRARCRAMVEQCERLLQEIARMERHGEVELVRRRDRVAATLQGMHGAKQAYQAYGESEALAGGHFDVSCDT
ncbi:MAG: flagellar export chaperone FlgN [Pirellulaceae bacterium]